jgi:lipopolysaccharide heptosyltransferase II
MPAAPPMQLGNLPNVAGRVLVKEVNWLGDLVLSMPALRTVRTTFPTSHLAILVRRELVGFFDGIDWLNEVIPYKAGRRVRLREQFKLIRTIRAHRFDLAILFPNSFQSALWVTLAGVRRRVGYGTDGRGFMLTHPATPAPDALDGHQSDYWLGMVRDTMGVVPLPEVRNHTLEVAERHHEKMLAWLHRKREQPDAPLIAIAPAAAYGPAKEWPLVRYSALVDLLADRFGAECVLVGAPAERLKCEQVAATSHFGAIVAAGETGIGELIALLSQCHGFAGNDSGAMHLAAALAVPTVGIFGSTNPARTGPLGRNASVVYHPIECSPCLERECRFGHYNCLRQVAPEEVAATLEKLGAFQ